MCRADIDLDAKPGGRACSVDAGRAVRWQVEVRQDVRRSLAQRAPELAGLDQRVRDAGGDGVDDALHEELPEPSIRLSVGGHHALIDPVRRFDPDVPLLGEQLLESGDLPVSEQARSRVEGAAGCVERVVFPAAPPEDVVLDPAAAVEGITGEPDHVERVHHGDRGGDLFGGGGLETGKPVHRDDLDVSAPTFWPFGEPGLEHRLRPPRPCPTAATAPFPLADGNSTEHLAARSKTFRQAAEAMIAASAHLKQKTLNGYEIALRVHAYPAFGNRRISTLKAADIDARLATLRAKPKADGKQRTETSVLGTYKVVRKVFSCAYAHRLIPFNPCIAVTKPQTDTAEARFLTVEEVNRLSAELSVQPPYDLLVRFGALTGLRMGRSRRCASATSIYAAAKCRCGGT